MSNAATVRQILPAAPWSSRKGHNRMQQSKGALPSGQEDQTRELFAEKERIARLGRIRELVFGSLDGLLVPLGVVSGVAGGTGSSRAVLVAGLRCRDAAAVCRAGDPALPAGIAIPRRVGAQGLLTDRAVG
jgi:hypothetical protein